MTATPERLTATRERVTAFAGLATLALVFGGQGLIQIGGAEPPFDAATAQIVAFFAARDQALFQAGAYLSVLSMLTLVWFGFGLAASLAPLEAEPRWRSPLVAGSAVLVAALVLNHGWELVVLRASEPVDPGLARWGFDLANLGFATAWVFLGSMAAAAGWCLLSVRRVLGWCGIGAGVLLAAARALCTSYFWLVGYALFWAWLIAVCITLLRGRLRHPVPHPPEPGR